MKTKFNVVLTLLLAFVVQLSFAQEKTISGTVSDDAGPLPGVSILIKGTQTGTETDFDGKYSLQASVGDVLVYSFVGMKSQEKTVGVANTINIVMEADNVLDEVVVLGYTSRVKNEVTGSVVTIKSDQIANVPAVSIDQALQGKVAGLQISTTSGTPGAVQDVRIRGVGSINASNSPLYVIDGVPVINNSTAGSGARTSLSSLVSLNAKDIESMTVLKDASATAAYGARGSNGVIVITTKRGKQGKAVFNFNSALGFQNTARNNRHPMSAESRATLLDEAVFNSYGAAFGFTADQARDFAIANGLGGIQRWDGSEYDWSNELIQEDAMMQDYNLSVSGGEGNSSFYASLGYNKTEMTVIGAPFERISGAFNFTNQLRDNVKFTQSVNVSNTRQNPKLETSSFFDNPHLTRYYMNPFINPYDEDGNYDRTLTTSIFNTLYTNENDITYNRLTRATSNSQVSWELINNLTFQSRLGMDYYINEYKNYQNRYHGGARNIGGSTFQSDSKNFNWVAQNSLNYKWAMGNHNFDLTGLFEYQKNINTFLSGYGENFPADGLTNIASAGANFDASSSLNDWKNVSYLGMLNYNYDGKYILDATFRREGSSRFANDNRFGNFGSVGLAWNVHKEDFLDGSLFNVLRLRGSWGLTGNSGIGLNTYQPLLSYSADYAGNGAVFPSQLGNETLTWEKGETIDFGIEFAVLDNRLSGNFAYFNRRTYDLLQSVPLSPTTGFASQNTNVGELINKGFEAELSYDIISNDNFSWNISGNLGTLKNEVSKLAKDSTGEDINPSATSSFTTTEIGQPLRSWFMRTWAGVDPATGDPTWYENGTDGTVTSNYSSAARVHQGTSALPTYNAGLSTNIEYKGVFLNASFYATGGHKVYERFAVHYLRTNSFTLGSFNGASELLERWQNPGDITDVPRLAYASNNNFHATSSRHLYDGDYIRLKDITLGYNVPSKALEHVGIQGLTFSLKGANLMTWVKDKGLKLDPEVQASGFTGLTTPPLKTVVFGVNVKF